MPTLRLTHIWVDRRVCSRLVPSSMASRRPSRLASGVTDAAVYSSTGSQELTSILNAPDSSSTSTWLAWPFAAASSGYEAPPPLPPGTLPEVCGPCQLRVAWQPQVAAVHIG